MKFYAHSVEGRPANEWHLLFCSPKCCTSLLNWLNRISISQKIMELAFHLYGRN